MTGGEIYRVKLPTGSGREQHGRRYGVIVQAEALLGLSGVLIAPTPRSAAAATFRPEVEVDGQLTRVLVEQLRRRPGAARRTGRPPIGLRAAGR